jgi:hypothetical protein
MIQEAGVQELQEFRSYRMDLPIRLVDGAISAPGSWLLAPGSWLLAPGSWLLAPGSWLLAPGSLKKIFGCWRVEDSCAQWLSAEPDTSELISSHD